MGSTAKSEWARTWLVALLLSAVALGPQRAHAAQVVEQPPVESSLHESSDVPSQVPAQLRRGHTTVLPDAAPSTSDAADGRAGGGQAATMHPAAETEVAPGLLAEYGDTSLTDRVAQTRRRALIHDAIAADPRLRYRNRLGQRLILTGCLVGGVATGVLLGSALMVSLSSLDGSSDPRDEVARIALLSAAGFTFLTGVAILSAGIGLKVNAKRDARIDVGLAVTDSSGGVNVGGRF